MVTDAEVRELHVRGRFVIAGKECAVNTVSARETIEQRLDARHQPTPAGARVFDLVNQHLQVGCSKRGMCRWRVAYSGAFERA
jgi:hypothetical protein